MIQNYDASGYATKNDLLCSDKRTIRRDAFKDQDGQVVPLVWAHLHNSPDNILGHALLENREDGVYTYLKFNDTEDGQKAKKLVYHKDITCLSIFANGLIEKSKSVLHGVIREVSLVLAGANEGAKIDNLAIAHGDGTEPTDVEDEAIIYTGLDIDLPEPVVAHTDVVVPEPVSEVVHAADTATPAKEETVQEIFDTLTDKQKNVVYELVAAATDSAIADQPTDTMKQSAEGDDLVKTNVFDEATKTDVAEDSQFTLSHSQFMEISADAMKKYGGSFKESFLAHIATYGIDGIDTMFPDARFVTTQPAMVQRKMAWVTEVINGTFHTPFARIKSLAADITADEARAKGYVKASLKTEEIITMTKRETLPTTIYKKQKLDREDVIDITGLDVVAWLKAEMRVMLDEELARAILIGDGRDPASPDKIIETRIRPIYKDAELYVERVRVGETADAQDVIEAVIRARKAYAGSGNPQMFVSSEVLSDMLLLKDTTGRRLYSTRAELETVLMVAKIVEVPVMTSVERTTEDSPAVNLALLAIIVNLKDYTVGADKGGEVSMFDNFDIDYNQLKYLIETRCSGALVLPKSAMVIEQVVAAG